MKLSELISGNLGPLANIEISGVTCDSRHVTDGAVFVCINGNAADGHTFAKDALKKGAAVIVCEKDLKLDNQIIVENTRTEFARMCANWFHNPAKKLKIIGVTGTNGKTSVSYMLKAILEKAGHKVGLVGTIQNMIGDEILPSKNTTPSAYELQSIFSLMLKSGCDYCVMEVSSHALDQDRVYGINFSAAMFTNLTQDHLDYHVTMENYMTAKRKLFLNCDFAVMNCDDDYYAEMSKDLPCRVVTYSNENNSADYTAKNINIRADGVDFVLTGIEIIGRIKTKIGGKFTPYNAMCAASCAVELGIPLDTVCEAFSEMSGVKGRAEVVPTGRDFTIIIDYAHTPDGLENILKTFDDIEKNRLIAVFGCGGDRDKTKRPKMGAIAVKYADYVIVTSDNPRTEDPTAIIGDIIEGIKGTDTPFEVVENRIDAIKRVVQIAEKGDIIVLAGKGHETYQILSTGTIHLDEREVVAYALKEL